MKIKSVELLNAVLIPGSKVSMDFTLNAHKQPGIELTLDKSNSLLLVTQQGKSAAIPLSNVRVIVLE